MKTGRVTLASEVADLAYFVPNMDSVAVSTITLYIVDHDRRFSYQVRKEVPLVLAQTALLFYLMYLI